MTIERARISTYFYLNRVRSEADDLLSKQFLANHPGPPHWLGLILGLIDTAFGYLKSSEDPGISAQKASELTEDASRVAREAYRYLQYISGSDISELPFPIVYPLQRWFDQLDINVTTFFRAEHVVNYELRPFEKRTFEGYRDKTSTLQDAIDTIDWPILRVTVPSKALGILPHFGIVAHEIGHAVYRRGQFGFGNEINWDLSSYNNEHGNFLKNIKARLPASYNDQQIHDKINAIFPAWFEELAADAIGYMLAGPAFYFALSEFFQLLSTAFGLSESHPPAKIRIKLIHSRMESEPTPNYSDILDVHAKERITETFNSFLMHDLPDKDALFNELRKNKKSELDAAVLCELCEFIQLGSDKMYEDVRAYLSKNYPDSIYTPSKFDTDLKNHLIPLINAIPPIEYGENIGGMKSCSFPTILNVGWVVLLTKLTELKVKFSDASTKDPERAESLNRLLLKAVELSEAKAIWDSAK